MPYISPKTFRALKEIDLLSYMWQAEPDNLKQVGRYYFHRQYDSLCIHPDTGLWHRQSSGIGGRNALEYLTRIRGMTVYEAARHLLDRGVAPRYPPPADQPQGERELVMPPPCATNHVMFQYLSKRGIHPAVIEYCVRNGLLYESREYDATGREYHNAVFVGCDRDGAARYGFIRGTGEMRFARDAEGSDKRYSFCIPATGAGRTLIKTEAAIDVLSAASLAYEKDPARWLDNHYLSSGGASDLPLERYTAEHPEIKCILLCNDNDKWGRCMTAKEMERYGGKGYAVAAVPPPCGKDYNDYLQIRRRRNRAVRPVPSRSR